MLAALDPSHPRPITSLTLSPMVVCYSVCQGPRRYASCACVRLCVECARQRHLFDMDRAREHGHQPTFLVFNVVDEVCESCLLHNSKLEMVKIRFYEVRRDTDRNAYSEEEFLQYWGNEYGGKRWEESIDPTVQQAQIALRRQVFERRDIRHVRMVVDSIPGLDAEKIKITEFVRGTMWYTTKEPFACSLVKTLRKAFLKPAWSVLRATQKIE